MLRRRGIALLALLVAVPLAAARAETADDVVAEFFGIWDTNSQVTPERVAALYGPEVLYYGEHLSNAGVYANKQAFIRRWPQRRYRIVPGTVSKGCGVQKARCAVIVTLAWQTASPARRASAHGFTRVSLDLERQDGTLKIVRESGRSVREP